MFTLVPSNFFNPAAERETLAEVANVNEGSKVAHIEIPQYDAVLIYEVEDGINFLPDIDEVLERLPQCKEYNKLLCSISNDVLNVAIAQGKTLLLANSYNVQDFTTAEYYIFLAMKSLQLNPEQTTICWLGELNAEDEMSLYRYFKSVNVL